MTGFARAQGTSGGATGLWRWSWELRSVNAKGLDLRLRLPNGFDALDAAARAAAGRALARGSVSGTFSIAREGETVAIRVNQPALEALVEAGGRQRTASPFPAPTLDALLAVKGVVEVVEAGLTPEDIEAITRDAAAGFEEALTALEAMRLQEGRPCSPCCASGWRHVPPSCRQPKPCPSARPMPSAPGWRTGALASRRRQAAGPGSPASGGGAARHQGGRARGDGPPHRPYRRRPCPARCGRAGGPQAGFPLAGVQPRGQYALLKSNAVALTQIGLDLKLLVDQFREQIQNIE